MIVSSACWDSALLDLGVFSNHKLVIPICPRLTTNTGSLRWDKVHRAEIKHLSGYIVQDDFFWKHTPLGEMTSTQWESLCDGCGKCCVLKLKDIDTNDIHYTNVGCRLLDCKTARCRDYQNRKKHVKDCIVLSIKNLPQLRWMPASCAYRLLYEGKSLPDWHPLVSGNPISPIKAGQSVAGRIFPETAIDEDDLPDHITTW